MALNLLADPLDSLQLSGGEEVGVTGSLPSHVTHYVNRNANKDVSLSTLCFIYIVPVFCPMSVSHMNILQPSLLHVPAYTQTFTHDYFFLTIRKAG